MTGKGFRKSFQDWLSRKGFFYEEDSKKHILWGYFTWKEFIFTGDHIICYLFKADGQIWNFRYLCLPISICCIVNIRFASAIAFAIKRQHIIIQNYNFNEFHKLNILSNTLKNTVVLHSWCGNESPESLFNIPLRYCLQISEFQ